MPKYANYHLIVTPLRTVDGYQRFEVMYHLHLQGEK